MALYARSVCDRVKNEALKKLHFKSIYLLSASKKVIICK